MRCITHHDCSGYKSTNCVLLINKDFKPNGLVRVPEDYFKPLSMSTEPKQRTIEEAQIGDIIYKKQLEWNVLGRLGDLLFLSKDKEDGSYFVKLGFLKDNGWKIKQPKPEKEVCTHCGK